MKPFALIVIAVLVIAGVSAARKDHRVTERNVLTSNYELCQNHLDKLDSRHDGAKSVISHVHWSTSRIVQVPVSGPRKWEPGMTNEDLATCLEIK